MPNVENCEYWIEPCWVALFENSQPVEYHRGVLRSVVACKLALMAAFEATVEPDTGVSVTNSIVTVSVKSVVATALEAWPVAVSRSDAPRVLTLHSEKPSRADAAVDDQIGVRADAVEYTIAVDVLLIGSEPAESVGDKPGAVASGIVGHAVGAGHLEFHLLACREICSGVRIVGCADDGGLPR